MGNISTANGLRVCFVSQCKRVRVEKLLLRFSSHELYYKVVIFLKHKIRIIIIHTHPPWYSGGISGRVGEGASLGTEKNINLFYGLHVLPAPTARAAVRRFFPFFFFNNPCPAHVSGAAAAVGALFPLFLLSWFYYRFSVCKRTFSINNHRIVLYIVYSVAFKNVKSSRRPRRTRARFALGFAKNRLFSRSPTSFAARTRICVRSVLGCGICFFRLIRYISAGYNRARETVCLPQKTYLRDGGFVCREVRV